jgi:hypothetical protein
MSPVPEDLPLLLARLEKVERQIRWLICWAVGASFLLVGVLAVAAFLMRGRAFGTPRQDVLKAKRVVVFGGGRVPRVLLNAGSSEEDATFSLNDGRGRERLDLRVSDDQVLLLVQDAHWNPRLILYGDEDASGIVLYDKNQKLRVELSCGKTGPVFRLLDENGKPLAGKP